MAVTRRRYDWESYLDGSLRSVAEEDAPHLASALRTKAARVGRRVRTRRVVVDGEVRVLFQFEPEDGSGYAPALDRAGTVAADVACPTCGRSTPAAPAPAPDVDEDQPTRDAAEVAGEASRTPPNEESGGGGVRAPADGRGGFEAAPDG